jgi:NADPH-dependent 2,4-dienoyl-CoA reductase/sulfur reductase-like enzyme
MKPDLLIVGAGPAGLAAAIEARARGLTILLLDENEAAGGRVWQAQERRPVKDADDAFALRTIEVFRASGTEVRLNATVWAIEPEATVFWSEAGQAHSAAAGRVLLATGTTERPLPIPGWTLPGVMTVGAAQIALKTAGLVPTGATWIAGQGPLLLLYAVQALRAGGRIAGILDLSDPAARWAALRHLPDAMRTPSLLAKGLCWRREIARAGVPWLRADGLRALGDGALREIAFRTSGRERRENADLLLLHDGVVPSVQITRALGCEHAWDAAQRCWRPIAHEWGATSLPQVLVAGDGAGIGGWQAAGISGRLAALGAAAALGRIDTATRDAAAKPLRAARARALGVRPFLDALYAPRPPMLDDATIVCRCEEVTAARIREAVRLGCLGLNQLKAFTRCGMGPCQGRMCGTTAAEVMAQALKVPIARVEPYRLRFPTKPLTLGELAALDDGGGWTE